MSSVDVVLSSGWLAFASHTGFLAALEEAEVTVDAVAGTSSGALTGALWASGMPARDILDLVTERRPLAWVKPHRRPWRGLLRLDPMLAELRRRLPATFADLARPLAVGVIPADRGFRLLSAGPLPEAVAASCAVPALFEPINVDGVAYADGGVADRLGLPALERTRGRRPRWVHLVRSMRALGPPSGLDRAAEVVESPRSGAQLWSLGDARARFERTRATTLRALDRAGGW